MGVERTPWFTSILLVGLLLGMSAGMMVQPPQDDLDDAVQPRRSGINEPTPMAITNADGTSSALKAEVPMGHTVEEINVSLSPDPLAFNDAFTWSDLGDWNASGAVLDRVNVNRTDGLQLLPRLWEWDFENANHGWSLGTGWLWGYDSCLGASGGVHGGAKAIYTYNCNYPNGVPSSGYFATSPVIDCGGCSGTWDLKYWKRLGIESYYYDDAQVHVKDSQGSWQTVWDWSSYSTNPTTWTQMNHDISTHVNGNSNLQIRFKLGRTDGSVTYTGWNVDDVSLEPQNGAGGGEQANWTSARFGPGVTGAYGTEGVRYGITSIDATIPSGSGLTMSVLDGVSKTAIPGFLNVEPTWVDLGSIDPEKHPSLRIKFNFDATGGATSPIVHEIHMNNRYGSTFNADPTTAGWTLAGMNWNGNAISGSGTLTSPVFTSHRALTQLSSSVGGSGTWVTDVSLDGGPWFSASNTGVTSFSAWGNSLQIRMSCAGSCTFNDAQFDLIGGHLPTHPRFDIGLDGWAEWQMVHPHISEWGWQSRFTNGQLSADMTWSAPGLKQVGMMLAKTGLDSFAVELAPFAATDPVDVSISVDGQVLFTKTVAFETDAETYALSAQEMIELNENLSNALTFWAAPGNIQYAIATVDVQGSYGSIRVGGLSALYRPTANLSFPVDSTFVMSMNQALPDAQIESQARLVPLTLKSSSAGGALGVITNLISAENVLLDGAALANFSSWEPVTPSWQWMEMELNYSWDVGVPSYLSMMVETNMLAAYYELPVDGSAPVLILLEGTNVSDPIRFGSIVFDSHEDGLNASVQFQTEASLDDSAKFKVSASLYMTDGSPSPPYTERSGQMSQGVENDVEVIAWDVYNELGLAIPPAMSYLRSNSPISIQTHIGFENLLGTPSKNPRTGDVRVHLLENGVAKMNTTNILEGHVVFGFTTPVGTGNVTYSLDIEPLAGQTFVAGIPLNRTFTVDSLNPQVVDQNIDRFDHRTPSPNQLIQIEVHDRPVLPTDLTLMVWREWADDIDGDGEIDEDEFTGMLLQQPGNLSQARGNYTLLLDDTAATEGDLVAAYVVGADPAGNVIIDSGTNTLGDQLFTYQVMPDGPPSLPGQGGFASSPDGKLAYLHPGVDYEFGLHIIEPNGWADIGDLRLQLASNSVSDTLAVEWSASDGRCVVLSPHMEVERCGVRAWTGELTPFNPDLEFFVEFSLNWTLPRGGDIRWEPSIEVTDRGGQGAWLSLPQLRWRYSPDLAIDTDDMTLSLASGTYSEEGAWVAPGSSISLNGALHFPVSGVRPSETFDVRILLDGQETMVVSEDGAWSASFDAPDFSGSFPLTVEIADLPSGANDVTDTTAALRWIVVDPVGPEVVEAVSPRPGSILPKESLGALQIQVRISELEQIDEESLVLHWKIIRGSDVRAIPLLHGESALTIEGGNLAGQSIIAGTILDLASQIPEEYYSDDLRFHIWVEGNDMAGNPMEMPSGTNQDDNPFASWALERRAPVFTLSEDDVRYSRSGDVEAGTNVMITVSVRNDGEVDGVVRMRLTEVHLDGTERELTAVAVQETIPAGGLKEIHVDWVPDTAGRQWIRITIEDGPTVNGPTLHAVAGEDDSLIGSIFGGVDLTWSVLFIGLIILLASVLLIALRSGGTRSYSIEDTEDDGYWDDDGEGEGDDGYLEAGEEAQPEGFPLDYRDETVRHVMTQNGISDTIGFLQHARGFDRDGNGYLNEAELNMAASSFVAAGSLVEAQVGTPALDPSTMTGDQLAWYEEAKKWGGYYDESGTWIPL
jgi:hypothetical protein